MNVGIATVVEFLQKKGYTVEANPNTKISEEQYAILVKAPDFAVIVNAATKG